MEGITMSKDKWNEVDADYDKDPDDELMDQTPPDVVEDLGFDPLEFEEE